MTVLTTLELEYVVRGYHEYKRVWTPVLYEMLSTEIERGNPHNEYTVVLILDGLLLVESRALLVIVLLLHLRGPASPTLGAFLDGLRDASALQLQGCQHCIYNYPN